MSENYKKKLGQKEATVLVAKKRTRVKKQHEWTRAVFSAGIYFTESL